MTKAGNLCDPRTRVDQRAIWGTSLDGISRRWGAPELASIFCWSRRQRSRQLAQPWRLRFKQAFLSTIRLYFLSASYRSAGLLFAILVPLLALTPSARAQTSAGPSQPLITQSINEGDLVVLSGNTRPEAKNPANDRGIVPDSLPMPNMMLQLRRPAAQEQAFVALIDQLHDPNSPNFHHWLSASEIGAQFGPAASDIQTITGWLQQHGFTVNTVYANGMAIDYSGTAGQVRTAFHTEIHNLSVDGVAQIANMTDPEIPAALAPAVVGVVALHDFKPHPMAVHKPQSTQNTPEYTSGGQYYVTPPDLATIYNFNPLFTAGKTGQGQTIYLVEDTDLYNTTDWSTFRMGFGIPVSSYPGASLTTVHPGCADPGYYGPAGAEATLDGEYASAAAPSAKIVMVACRNFVTALNTMFGNQGTYPPDVISISYGECEVLNLAVNNAAFNTAYQTGVAEGWSIYVSAGDQSASGCQGGATAIYGIGVNGFASTQYNVAVGGTDFGDTYAGTNSTYWNASNTASGGSAKSYIPEIPWNSTCGGVLYASKSGYPTTYGSSGFVNHCPNSFYLENWGGSGGPSACATGSATISGVVSGTCAGWPKPSWQSGFSGIQSDNVRDLPDVSLFSSFDPWNHSYVICFSDTNNSGVACNGTASGWDYGWGGTSFASPIWAGIQALVNQQAGGKQGNPNTKLYTLAATEYGAGGSSACNSTNGNTVATSCIFYDVTLGDNDAPCKADSGTLYNCYLPSGTYGVLSTSNSSYLPAFKTTTGWDFATGIGTVNVYNLVMGWSGGGGGTKLADIHNTHDFNGDGYSDIAWRNADGDVAIWLMDGTQILLGPGLGNIPTSWTIVGRRDFNGDGHADLLWRNTDGDVAMWFMNGTQVLSGPDFINIPTSWTIVGTGDFNGDGKGDILWRNADGDVAIWLMNGTQILSGPGLGNIPNSWTIVGTGDFNGDGYSDILWRNTDGDVAIWLMKGTQLLSGPGLGNIPTSWAIFETGDFNGAGYTDILWRNTDGDVAIWFMKGTQVLSGPDFINIPTSWSIQGAGAD